MNSLNTLRKRIERMQESTHSEIFKITQKYKIPFTENSNGIFINMDNLSNECIAELEKHIKWLEEQQDFLSKAENVKKNYRDNFFQ